MSIQTQIDRLASAKVAIKTAIEGKGVTVPNGTILDGFASLIDGIEAGGGGVYFGHFHGYGRNIPLYYNARIGENARNILSWTY